MPTDSPLLLFFSSTQSGPSRRMESLLAHIARKERTSRSGHSGRRGQTERRRQAARSGRRAYPGARSRQASDCQDRGPGERSADRGDARRSTLRPTPQQSSDVFGLTCTPRPSTMDAVRRSLVTLCLTALVLVPAALSRSSAPRCDERTPKGSFVDCFSGAYHGTGFMPPMDQTMSFRLASPTDLHKSALWSVWLADAKKTGNRKPCQNTNAMPYIGSFSFYGSGSFIGCSEAKPNMLNGYFMLKRSFFYADDETTRHPHARRVHRVDGSQRTWSSWCSAMPLTSTTRSPRSSSGTTRRSSASAAIEYEPRRAEQTRSEAPSAGRSCCFPSALGSIVSRHMPRRRRSERSPPHESTVEDDANRLRLLDEHDEVEQRPNGSRRRSVRQRDRRRRSARDRS